MVRNMLSDSHVILSKYDHIFSKSHNYYLEEAIVAKSPLIEIYFNVCVIFLGREKSLGEKKGMNYFCVT